MKNIKNQKGITLVSLVVTIIILIILAGVSINAIIGENGIITIAKRAKENIELAQIEEERELNELYMQLETEEGEIGRLSYDAIGKLSKFKKKIADYIDEAANGSIDLINEYVKPNYETASIETFGSAIKQIVARVTALDEDKAATSEDILEGKEAWVNGKLITGTKTLTVVSKIGTYQGTNVSAGANIINRMPEANTIEIDIKTKYDSYTSLTKENFLMVDSLYGVAIGSTTEGYSVGVATTSEIIQYDNQQGILKIKLPYMFKDSGTHDSLDFIKAGSTTIYIVTNVIDLSE